MKTCPVCDRLYDPEAGFCPVDGEQLIDVEEAETPSDDDDPRVGQTICKGRYKLWRIVADGGMGRVYQGIDTEKERGVAIKILHDDVALDEVAVERFKREYAFSKKLSHEHIVEVLDFERTEDKTYALVMEYLEGEELRHYLQREKSIPDSWMVRMLSQLALGLREPHERKIVHRDIKPDNIFLVHTPDGPQIKLLDFGSVRDNSEGAKKLTVVGTTIGSPFYMSPEQAQGLPELDHRADVWSLAAIAYECLTGEVPFEGKTGPAILLAILSKEPVPPSLLGRPGGNRQKLPSALDDVISDALSKDASIRTESVAKLADGFGQGFGLEGDHEQWAYTTADELTEHINEAAERAAEAAKAAAEAAEGDEDVPSSRAPSSSSDADPSYFDDDDFAMGVPSGPPIGLYVGVGAVALAVIGLILFFVL